MTIYTKQSVVNAEKKGEASIKIEVPEKNLSVVVSDRLVRRRRLCLQFVLLLGLLVGLSICVLGSIYLYKKHAAKRYSGWCGVKYLPSDLSVAEPLEPTTAAAAVLYLDEEVIVNNDVETLKVPKFDDNDEATFVHDFGRNITLIKDIADQVCYILPLDRQVIPVPQNFLQLLFGLSHGDYIPKAQRIREEYRVVEPAIPSAILPEMFGDYIADQCKDVDTYNLTRVVSAELTTMPTTTTAAPSSRKFAMYAGGDALLQYIVNTLL